MSRLRPEPHALIGETENKRESSAEARHVMVSELAYFPSKPFAPDRDRLVRHDLRPEPQSIVSIGIDGDTKIGCIRKIGCQLTDNYRGVTFRKRVSLHDYRRTWLTIVAGRSDSNQVTSAHRRQTRRPLRSNSRRCARDESRGQPPAWPPADERLASADPQRSDATRVIPGNAGVDASSSSVRLARPWTSPSVTRYNVTRYGSKARS